MLYNSDHLRWEQINKGWSEDKKFYMEAQDGRKFLMRTSDVNNFDRKKAEFEVMVKLHDLGIPMSTPLDFGINEEGNEINSLFLWCEGEEAENVLPGLTDKMQYELGIKAGRILKTIHSIPAPVNQEKWSTRFVRKVESKIIKYLECSNKYENGNLMIEYIHNNINLLDDRPQSLQHGDYHVGNMIINENHELSVIDFNRYDYGDPWEEFNRVVFSAKASPLFATGQINGYFGKEPPEEFFRLLALYICSNTLASAPWALMFGKEEVKTMNDQAKDVLEWFDNMKSIIPSWYCGFIQIKE